MFLPLLCTLTLYCNVTNNDTIRWQHISIHNYRRVRIQPDYPLMQHRYTIINKCDFQLQNVTYRDIGIFQAYSLKTTITHAQYYVYDGCSYVTVPHTFKHQIIYANISDTVALHYNVCNNYRNWVELRHGQNLIQNGQYTQHSHFHNCTLIIPNVTLDDAGEYTANNEETNLRQSYTLVVIGSANIIKCNMNYNFSNMASAVALGFSLIVLKSCFLNEL